MRFEILANYKSYFVNHFPLTWFVKRFKAGFSFSKRYSNNWRHSCFHTAVVKTKQNNETEYRIRNLSIFMNALRYLTRKYTYTFIIHIWKIYVYIIYLCMYTQYVCMCVWIPLSTRRLSWYDFSGVLPFCWTFDEIERFYDLSISLVCAQDDIQWREEDTSLARIKEWKK